MTLTLFPGSWVLGSAHCLTKRNIRVKFNENLSKGSGDMGRTQKCCGRNDIHGWMDKLRD